ncbi:unnamed protein product [Albugo candida]|uniref:GAG-pre-integrase domain-containing protein n=1 Tax=Albugo candida TaxID=65357 RepID=A0A024G9P4_9STRA|nr:unnamed protein product [Albugo candida]|eukprot:CCI43601.1 unnamed protein product [Albugo candida]
MGKLFEKGCSLTTKGDVMCMHLGKNPLLDFQTEYGVFVADLTPSTPIMAPKRLNEIVMTTVQDTGPTTDVHKGSLHHFHRRLGHIAYDTVEHMVNDPDYGIELIDHVRAKCITTNHPKRPSWKQIFGHVHRLQVNLRACICGTAEKCCSQDVRAFLAWSENEFNCRIHVLRTDGGGEYEVVGLFCKQIGVRRQVTEKGTP